jgi:hypothetical protein
MGSCRRSAYVRQLATDLADAKAMRSGSLPKRTMKCSKTSRPRNQRRAAMGNRALRETG